MKATAVGQILLGLKKLNQNLFEGQENSVPTYRLYPIGLVPPFDRQQKYHAHSSQKR